MSRVWTLLVVAALLAGCSGDPNAAPSATAQVLPVEITTGLDWLRPGMAECAGQLSGLALQVTTTPAADQKLIEGGIGLRWSSEAVSDGFAFALGEERLTLIVNPENPLEEVDAGTIKGFYTGQLTAWPGTDGDTAALVQPWVLPPGEEAMDLFQETFLAGDSIVQTALIAPTPAAMLEAVAGEPLAIGFIPARWLDSSVKALDITGLAESQLAMPILAVGASQPEGLTREWLLCVQEVINRSIPSSK